jgi:signal transduction histidine kinase
MGRGFLLYSPRCQGVCMLERQGQAVAHSPPSYDTSSEGTQACPAALFGRDRLLLGALLFSGVLVGFQLVIVLLLPPWATVVTDWLRAGVAWLAFAALVFVGARLVKEFRPQAWCWWIVSLGMLAYALGQSLAAGSQLVFDRRPVIFPWWTDALFFLEYFFFFLALAFWPAFSAGRPRPVHWKVVFDSLLLMGAATALFWYFLLAPLYMNSHEPFLGKVINIAYAAGDLGLLLGLILILIPRHQERGKAERAALVLLILAVAVLIFADVWYAWLNLQGLYTRTSLPVVLWLLATLLAALAGLTHLRLIRSYPPPARSQPLSLPVVPPEKEHIKEVARFISPLVVALLAGVLIALRAIIAPINPMNPLIPSLVIFGLLVLVILRQGIAVLENAQLQQKWVLTDAHEQALQEANRRMETFLGIAGHELKTPLTTIILSLQMLQRRLKLRSAAAAGQKRVEITSTDLALPLQQAGRLNRLVNDLLDTSRIQAGRLELMIRPVDLVACVRAAVEEQRQAAPNRIITLQVAERPVFVAADAGRIRQVVTNYVTNALKYSAEQSPVDVGVQVEGLRGLVWVRDVGPGLTPADQERVWERFYRAPGVEIQSGSGVGLGVGLYISKTIILRHEGQVGVQSVPGQGSTFWFALPLALPAEVG